MGSSLSAYIQGIDPPQAQETLPHRSTIHSTKPERLTGY